jgi:RNA polymerase sigma-70 factor (ECF subfamily)
MDEDVQEYLRTRSDAAFLRIYDAHAAALFGVALRVTGGVRSDAEDVFQEAWRRACSRFSSFEGRSSLRTWLTGFIVRCAHETLRNRFGPEEYEGSGPAPPLALAIDLERAVETLAPGARMVLVLHDIEGYTHEEIAGMLGIETGTSKSQLSRARRQLRLWMNVNTTA